MSPGAIGPGPRDGTGRVAPTTQHGSSAHPGEGQRDQTQQFGQPPYGQQPGRPALRPAWAAGPARVGPQPYGQPQYGQQPGQPAVPGAAAWASRGVRPAQYGQQPGQPGYGQPGQQWAPPGGPGGQQPKGNKNTLIALIVAGVVVLAAIGVALFLLLGNDDEEQHGQLEHLGHLDVLEQRDDVVPRSSSSFEFVGAPQARRPVAGGSIPAATVTPGRAR